MCAGEAYRAVTEKLMPEMQALLADVRARLDRAAPWEEARRVMTLRLQAAAHAEVDDPLARAVISALCRRLVRNTDIAAANHPVSSRRSTRGGGA
jgi:hypothetical protein